MDGPFAAGLKEISGPGPKAWAFGVNGFFSVAGSLLATLLGPTAGHLWVTLVAAGAYLLAAWAAPWRRCKTSLTTKAGS